MRTLEGYSQTKSAPRTQAEWDGLDTLMEADRCRREHQQIYSELCALENHSLFGRTSHAETERAYQQAFQDGHIQEAIFHAKRLMFDCVLTREPENAVKWAVCAFFLQLAREKR